MGYQLRWLERTPDKGEVPGSSPGWPTAWLVGAGSGLGWGYSSVGRALPLHGRSQRFESAYLHQRRGSRLAESLGKGVGLQPV